MIPASYFFRDLLRSRWADAPAEPAPAETTPALVPAFPHRPVLSRFAAGLVRLPVAASGLLRGAPRPSVRRS